jgi:hypothetical protein
MIYTSWNDDERSTYSSIKYNKVNLLAHENYISICTFLKQFYDDEKKNLFVYNNTNIIHKSIPKIYYPKPFNLPSLKYELSNAIKDSDISINKFPSDSSSDTSSDTSSICENDNIKSFYEDSMIYKNIYYV